MSDVVFKSDEAASTVEELYRHVLEQWPVPRTELHLPTCQGSTFVIACGPEDAPPVVLLHGAQANSAVWIPDIAQWSTKFRLFAVDMIGEPGFSARVRPALNGDEHARWLDDVFSGLGLSCATLVGTSLGGWLALDYANRRPGAVQALALMCPAGIGRQKNFLLKVLPLLLFGSWGKQKIRSLVFGSMPKELPDDIQVLSTLMESAGNAVRPRVVKIPQLSDAALSSLRMPILAIVGGKDALLDSKDTKTRLQRFAPHAEVCFLSEGYHFLPDQTVRILNFLERNR